MLRELRRPWWAFQSTYSSIASLFSAGVMNIFANSICFDIVDGVGSTNLLSGHFDSTIKVWDTRDSRDPKHVIKVDGHVTSLSLGTGERRHHCHLAALQKTLVNGSSQVDWQRQL